MGYPKKLIVVWLLVAGGTLQSAEAGFENYARLVMGEEGLAGYWRLEGDLKDARGTAHGEARGGAPAFQEGPGGGQCLEFQKGLWVNLGKAPHLDLDQGTLELWFQPRFPKGIPYNPCLLAKRKSSPETRLSVHLWSDYSQLAFWNGSQVVRFAPRGRPLRAGEWYYLAVTWSRNSLEMVLDGLPCRRLGGPGTVNFKLRELPLQLASSAPEGVELFEGAMDDVALYSRVLSVSSLEKHMDARGAKKRLSLEEILAEEEKTRRQQDRAARERLAPYFSEESLFGRGGPRIYRGESLGAIRLPVGGIGAGSVQIDGKGRRPVWQIFGNMTQAFIPDSFFAIRIQWGKGKPFFRALQTEPEGSFDAMKSLSFRGEYPFGWFEFEDSLHPVKVKLEAFNPLVPLDLKASSIPCAIYNITVENPSLRAVQVSLLGSQQNVVGFTGQGGIQNRSAKVYGGNRNRILSGDLATILHMTSEKPQDAPGSGDLALVVLDPKATFTADWKSTGELAADLADGSLGGLREAGPSPPGQTINGAVASSFLVLPDEQRTVTFALTWHFPNVSHGHGSWGGKGNNYANWWKDSLDVADHLLRNLENLTRKTRLYHDTLYESNLPWWLLDRISSQLVVLRSPTCFWTKEGYFGGWEGCNAGGGCCAGNCNHVWQYAQAHARVFPSLGRSMREQELRFMTPEGAIPHRQPKSHPAFDGQCGGILGAYREHCSSPDGAWLSRHWPAVKKAIDHVVARWDQDGDGVLSGPQWNTLDGNLGGSTSWLGTMYLAALAASEKMALIQGDQESAERYSKIRASGSRKQDETLFNGEYYIQIPDPEPQEDYIKGCHIDQVLGQWWAHQLDLGWLYPPERVRAALRSLFRYNFRYHFHGIQQLPRKFVADDDPGMQMITWPQGGLPQRQMRYASEVMSGFEYSAAGAMIQAGLLREGLSVIRAASIRYDGRLRTGLAAWGYSGNPFCDDECGKFYARPMSIWSLLLACQGFILDGPAGVIGFQPPWKPEDHVSFFTASEGWGLFRQRRAEGEQSDRIEVKSGRLAVKELVFEIPEGVEEVKVSLDAGGRPLSFALQKEASKIRIRLRKPEVIEAGRMIETDFNW